MQRVWSRSTPRHFLTTVVEFPIARIPPVVCLSYGKPRDSTLRYHATLQTQPAASLGLLAQPAWNDVGGVLA